jgi:hypothetical protein
VRRRVGFRRNSVISLATGRAAQVERHRRGGWTPALALDLGATWVVIRNSASDRVTARDVAFARELAHAAGAFADAIARHYSRTASHTGTRDDGKEDAA